MSEVFDPIDDLSGDYTGAKGRLRARLASDQAFANDWQHRIERAVDKLVRATEEVIELDAIGVWPPR